MQPSAWLDEPQLVHDSSQSALGLVHVFFVLQFEALDNLGSKVQEHAGAVGVEVAEEDHLLAQFRFLLEGSAFRHSL